MFYRCAHICRSHVSRSHMCTPSTKAHFVNRIAACLQVHIVLMSMPHSQGANILQEKHHVNWFTSCSSIASSNMHISFTLADPIQTVRPMQFIPVYHFHKCKPCSQVHIYFLHIHAVQLFKCVHPAIRRQHIGSITFECVRSVRKVS